MNLVKKLALTLAIASTITLSSCGTSEELENLTANLSADSSTALTNIVFVMPETTKENNYVSLIGHFDTDSEYAGIRIQEWIGYKNHKDYRITYKVSKEDYAAIVKINSKRAKIDGNSKKEDLLIIQKIIDNYDPIEIAELEVEDNYKHENYLEEFYFNEEKYLNSLE